MASLSYSNTFSNVNPSDFILRTIQNSQQLVIGNGGGSNSNACMYIQQNKLGFRQPPKSNLVFDCINTLQVDEDSNVLIPTMMYVVQAQFSNITISSNEGGLISPFLRTSNLSCSSTGGTLNIANDSNTSVLNIASFPTSTTQNINIGHGQNTNINIGRNPTDVVVISGVTTTISSTQLDVLPKSIRLNAAGISNTANSCGVEFIENSNVLGHFKTTSNGAGFSFKPPSGQEFIIESINSNVSFQSGRLVIGSNGFIGVGTMTPDVLLTVDGNVRISQNISSVSGNIPTLVTNTLSCSNANMKHISAETLSNISASITNAVVKTVEFDDTENKNGKLVLYKKALNDHEISAIGYSNDVLKVQLDATNKKVSFTVASDSTSSTEAMRIQGNGNVGIGISPSIQVLQKLEVNGNISANNTVLASFFRSSTTSNVGIEPSVMTGWTQMNRINNNGGISFFEDKHIFTKNGVMFGNTQSSNIQLPQHTLQVQGNSVLQKATFCNDVSKLFIHPLAGQSFSKKTLVGEHVFYDETTDKYIIVSDGQDCAFGSMVASCGSVSFYTAKLLGQTTNYDMTDLEFSSLERMCISSNVGIGTNTPSAKLHVSGDGMDNRIKATSQSNYTVSLDLEDDNGFSWNIMRPGLRSVLKFSNTDRNVAYMMRNGMIGVGSIFENTAPLALLHIQDTLAQSNVFHAGNGLGSVRLTADGKLNVWNGSGLKYFEATNNISDYRLKTNIKPLNSKDALEMIENLQGVYFNYTSNTGFGDKKHVGCIAQDVAKHLPEVVDYDDDTGYYRMNYDKIVPVLIESVKELSSMVKQQQLQIQYLMSMTQNTTP